ncbi:MAG: type II toxin-antitoxin system HicA family toxin [Deltaproteobacteria bacterium]|nr:type II toxin-antitoxin system HicA family toxin [Deltaproteobacteria bacterium]
MSKKFPAVAAGELIKVLNKIGFVLKRQSGTSHAIYYRAHDGKRTTVPVHSKTVIKRKTLKSILADAGLTIDEFIELKKK